MLQQILGFSSFGTSKYKKHESVEFAMRSSNLQTSIKQFINRKPKRSDKMEDLEKPRKKE